MLLSRPTSRPTSNPWVSQSLAVPVPAPICTWTKNSHPDMQQMVFKVFFFFSICGGSGEIKQQTISSAKHPESDHFFPLLCPLLPHRPSHHHLFLAWLNSFRISSTSRSSAVQHFSNCLSPGGVLPPQSACNSPRELNTIQYRSNAYS